MKITRVRAQKRKCTLINLKSFGEDHPRTEVGRKNYSQLLQAMGLAEADADAKIQAKLAAEA